MGKIAIVHLKPHRDYAAGTVAEIDSADLEERKRKGDCHVQPVAEYKAEREKRNAAALEKLAEIEREFAERMARIKSQVGTLGVGSIAAEARGHLQRLVVDEVAKLGDHLAKREHLWLMESA